MSALLLGCLMSVSLVAQDKKPEPAKAEAKKEQPKDREGRFAAIVADFKKEFGAFDKAMRAAKTRDEQEEASKLQPDPEKYRKAVLPLVEIDPRDGLACDMLLFLLADLGVTDTVAVKLLGDHHAANPKVLPFVRGLVEGMPDELKPFLRKVIAANPSKEAKGLATFALATGSFADYDEKQSDAARKTAENGFDDVVKNYGDVKVGNETLAVMCKGYLTELRDLVIGKVAPDVASKDLAGKDVKLSDYRGKVVVLDIWATWCGPCRGMIPHERELVARLKDKPFVFVSVSADDDKKDLEGFLEKEKMPWTHWWNKGAENPMLRDWNIRFFPTIYILDAEGRIRFKGVRGKAMDKAVDGLVAEAEKKPKK